MFILSCKVLTFSWLIIRQVSSANSLGEVSIAVGMSLIYIRNKRGPNVLPCGTPKLFRCVLELTPFKLTNCSLSR